MNADDPRELRALVVMPTYNELENIGRIIPEILEQGPQFDVLVVDDNSPDGTAAVVKELQKEHQSRIHLLERASKMGLGTAYVSGFNYALKHDYDFIFEMDADFSHDPKMLPHFLEAIKEADLILGSRYHDPNERALALGHIQREWAVRELPDIYEIDTTYLTEEETATAVIELWQQVVL